MSRHEAAFAATPVGLETVGVKNAGLAWADFNEDGCLDVIVTTNNPAGPDQWTQLYRSNCSLPNPTFTNVTASHAPGLANARIARPVAQSPGGLGRPEQRRPCGLHCAGHVPPIGVVQQGPGRGAPAYGFGDAGGNPVVLIDLPDLISPGSTWRVAASSTTTATATSTSSWRTTTSASICGTTMAPAPSHGGHRMAIRTVLASLRWHPLATTPPSTDFDVDGDVDFLARKEAIVDLWVNTGGSFVAGGLNVATLNANKGGRRLLRLRRRRAVRHHLDRSPNDAGVPAESGGYLHRHGCSRSSRSAATSTARPVATSDNDGDLDLFLTDTNGVDLLYPNTSTPGSISFGASTFRRRRRRRGRCLVRRLRQRR